MPNLVVPVTAGGMPKLSRSAILRNAWAKCREARTFNGEFIFGWEGREVFAECLRQAWFEAKQEAGRLSQLDTDRAARADRIRQEIDGLKYKTLRYDIGRMERGLKQQLAHVYA